MASKRGTFARDTIVLIMCILFAFALLEILIPRFSHGTYFWDSDAPQSFDYPLKTPGRDGVLTVSMDMNLWFPYVFFWKLEPDNCLEEVIINGKVLESDRIPFCGSNELPTFFLGKYIHPGKNHIIAKVKDTGWVSGFYPYAAPLDPFVLITETFLIASILIYGWKRIQ